MKFLRILVVIFALAYQAGWAAQLQINITGVSGAILTNIENKLQAEKKALDSNGLTTNDIHHFYYDAPNNIIAATSPFGYFKPEITSSLRYLNKIWVANFKIQLGHPIIITQVDLQLTGAGAQDPVFKALIKNFPLKTNQVLNTELYEKEKDSFFNTASEYGYFKAKMLENRIEIDLHNYQAVIHLHFYTGPRYQFGETVFSAAPYSTKLLQRFLPYQQGQYFNNDRIQQLQQDLSNSTFFSQVTVSPAPPQPHSLEVPITIQITPRPAREYAFGAGYGTDTGLRGLASINFNRLTRSGHQLTTSLQLSQVNSYGHIQYSIPGKYPAFQKYLFSADINNYDLPIGKSKSATLGAGYQTQLGNWQQIFMLNWLKERYNLPTVSTTSTYMLYPSISWNYLQFNDPTRPTKGINVQLSAAGSQQSLGSQTSFFQIQGEVKTLFTILENNRFLLRGQAGYTLINDINSLPLSLQLLAGGAASIRGYSFHSLGPGTFLLVGSAEYQRRIYGDWYLALFYDTGSVSNSFDFNQFYSGVGPGIVWLSPVGALELTFAKALNRPGKPWCIQFNMGPLL